MNTELKQYERLKRYELFGWDYERYRELSEQEINWYEGFARRTGGPVLELACGTGSLLPAIAEKGYEVVGLDLSTNMLRLARERVSQLPVEVQGHIQLHQDDMSNFQLDRKFGLIFIADNSFRELDTKEQMLSCLKCVYQHLRPSGRFLMTVRRFDPARFVNGRREWGWSEPIRHPTTGDLVTRKVINQLSEDGKRLCGVMVYKTIYGDGAETMEECPYEAPVMLTEDYLSLLSEASFSTTVFVNYEEREDDGVNPILCFVCRKEKDDV